jgi:diguanylate cyclase (GGDEF)-like protein
MGAVATFQDISARKRTQAQVWMKANYDHLTGLPNRSLFHDRLERAVLQEARRHGQVAVLFIDLDGFKSVNDQLGHDAGDALLKEAAHRIDSCLRESDTAARMGGDEFTVVLTEISDRKGVQQVAEKILGMVAMPYHITGRHARISCSIGIALYPQHAVTVTALLRRADKAMYLAKRGGKNAIVFHGDVEYEEADPESPGT